MRSVFLLRRCTQSIHRSRAALLQSDWELAGSSERLSECADWLGRLRPDVLACDLRLFDGHVSRLLRGLRHEAWAPKVLLFSSSADEVLLYDTLASGAHGYWMERQTSISLAMALDALYEGRALMSPMIARQALAALALPRLSLEEAHQLRLRSLEPGQEPTFVQPLLSLLSLGLLPREIAQLWELALEQVEQALAQIYRRLHRVRIFHEPDLPVA
ncbi:hypothetical protein PFX98_05275 [Paucibacter sediminis]|uniref:Response regulator transcription factor n=1 Tax=Paucibacter sediminis TaxID=3019553 RepID=A0AA95ND70_9BURK|nr:hypothetical protein [Paucibacter sp. S2-9]WIT13020.1 hypothetical protein PFX98_05275 [Paucibacter sp. S2-9]